ncbi:MAG: hypothetical protein JSV01_08195 [Desulfobacterales bacterium]|nr:MAG: hypothetical protein JSV01_08195 [Desulfobacterales bacterium]
MYGCSPRWRADWMSEMDVEKILVQLSDKLRKRYPSHSKRIGVNYGIHFTGGEPFLNFDLLLKAAKKAHELDVPSTFVETNCFWCTRDETTLEKFKKLKNAGLRGILISVNPFLLEWVPFERTQRGIEKSRKVFGRKNVIVYQEFFHDQFNKLKIKRTLPFEEYLEVMYRTNARGLYESLAYSSVIPMGRAVYDLRRFNKKYASAHFFGASCREELTRPWHIHIDNYCNYMSGYCGGISLGDARDIDAICQGIDLERHPILNALTSDIRSLYEFAVSEWGYKVRDEGYISKCLLCVDIRKHIVSETDSFRELNPREFYDHLA